VNYFITATDTGAGKTFVTSLLVRGLRKAGIDAVPFKPICCGGREDAELLASACDGRIPLEAINPVWLRAPAAPYAASMVENRVVDLDMVRKMYRELRNAFDSVLVEGIGGWLVPITRDFFVSDLAAEFGLPVVVVVNNRLGALNHTFLTVNGIRTRGVECAGIILNQAEPCERDPATATNRAILEELAGVPILFEIDHGQRVLELAIA
jgi:dethiobiotin synthetase